MRLLPRNPHWLGAVAAAVLVTACASSSTSSSTDSSCTKDDDCSARTPSPGMMFTCAFPLADGCGAKGKCVEMTTGSWKCGEPATTYCDCAGTKSASVDCFYPAGYVPFPAGTCAAVTDAGGDASKD